jgi:hypothetical protein
VCVAVFGESFSDRKQKKQQRVCSVQCAPRLGAMREVLCANFGMQVWARDRACSLDDSEFIEIEMLDINARSALRISME